MRDPATFPKISDTGHSSLHPSEVPVARTHQLCLERKGPSLMRTKRCGPQVGFPVNENTLNLKDTVVLALSHSGGTFGTLACCNLLRSYTSSIFAVTSEWDTQVSSDSRQGRRQARHDSFMTSRLPMGCASMPLTMYYPARLFATLGSAESLGSVVILPLWRTIRNVDSCGRHAKREVCCLASR